MEKTILIVLLFLAAAYLAVRVIRSLRLYQRVRGPLLAVCPETKQSVVIELAAGTMALEAVVGDYCFRVKRCSRWPLRRDCGQDCLKCIEERFPDLKSSGAFRSAIEP
jgi:hypothetical protein